MTNPKTTSRAAWQRRLLLQATAGIGLLVGGVRYYFTHPRRVMASVPPDLATSGRDVFIPGGDDARLHSIWLKGNKSSARQGRREGRTIIHHPGFSSSGGIVLARQAPLRYVTPSPPHIRDSIEARRVPNNTALTAWPLVRAALARGYNFLLVDARAHGQSDGPWDPKGLLAADDLMGWVRWLRKEQGQTQVGLWGNSFGSVVGLTLATRPDHGGLNAMVLDSPAVSGRGLFAGVFHKPLYWVVQPVIWQLANDKLHAWLQKTAVTVPILLIHGMADTHVPPWHSEEAYRLIWSADAPERTELWLVPNADHLEALEVAPEMYIQRTLGWFDRWM